MPIKIPNNLPAVNILAKENIFVMNETRALSQDIRPLKFVIVNLMPTKIETETQLLRLLSNTPLQMEVTLLKMDSYVSKNISEEHMENFYKTFNDIKDEKEYTKFLKEELKKYIPVYMIPKKIRFLEKLPMNNNGKVDRKELKRILENK